MLATSLIRPQIEISSDMPVGCSLACSVLRFFIKNLHEDKEGILIKSADNEKPRELTFSGLQGINKTSTIYKHHE